MTMGRGSFLLSLSLAGLLGGCGDDAPRTAVGAAEFGRALLENPRLSESRFNVFACTTCHAIAPEMGTTDPSRHLSGHTLYNVAFRPHFYGGNTADLLAAINFCYVYFMKGVSALTAEDPRAKALYEALVSLSPSRPSGALAWTVVRDVTALPSQPTPASVERGRDLYTAACANCHGDSRTGRGRLDSSVPILAEIISTYPTLFPGIAPGVVVVEKVRHGQFFGVGGNMPPFALERLSDAELADILAFLGVPPS